MKKIIKKILKSKLLKSIVCSLLDAYANELIERVKVTTTISDIEKGLTVTVINYVRQTTEDLFIEKWLEK